MTDKTEITTKINTVLKDALTRLMAENELTMSILADFSGLTRDCVYRIMIHDKVPNVTTLCMIAKVLRVTLDDLVTPSAYQ